MHASTFRGRWRPGWVEEDGAAEGDWYENAVPLPCPDSLDYGALIGRVEVIDCLDLATALQRYPDQACFAPLADCFAWVFASPQRLPMPVKYKGSLNLFDVAESALHQTATV